MHVVEASRFKELQIAGHVTHIFGNFFEVDFCRLLCTPKCHLSKLITDLACFGGLLSEFMRQDTITKRRWGSQTPVNSAKNNLDYSFTLQSSLAI